MVGFSLKLSDKRVDKILLNIGIKESEIFYSPIQSWITFWTILILTVLPVFIGILIQKPSIFASQKGIPVIFIYFTISYLVIRLLNRSFAITDKEFLIINSHFPFYGIERFQLEEVIETTISSNWTLKFLLILGLFGNNYVEIRTKNQRKKFYCLFLDVDCYDENWTERTLDDLERSLKHKGINVKLEI